jgi:hypothetical protein
MGDQWSWRSSAPRHRRKCKQFIVFFPSPLLCWGKQKRLPLHCYKDKRTKYTCGTTLIAVQTYSHLCEGANTPSAL